MKIGILTFHKSINNGAVLQCYSLWKKLTDVFPEEIVEVIDYEMPKIKKRDNLKFSKHIKGRNPVVTVAKFFKFLIDPNSFFSFKKRRIIFENTDNMFKTSDEKIFDDGTEKLFNYINENYDVVIVGSDAIWNYLLRGFPNPYFLDDSLKVKKVTYAASCFGMDYEKIPAEQKARISEILSSYLFLGTRDVASEKFLDYIGCSVSPVHTCDPTVFLNVNDLPVKEDELKRKLISKGFDFNKNTIAVMGTEIMCRMVKEMYGDSYQIVALYNYCKSADVNLYELNPYEWAYVFRYFKLTFTTFFHGTLLSLRNGVPLICIDLNTEFGKKHTPKTLDVLKRVGFEDWYFSTDYKSQNLDKIKAKADELLAGDYHDAIISAMDKEAESFEAFNNALKAIAGKDGKND